MSFIDDIAAVTQQLGSVTSSPDWFVHSDHCKRLIEIADDLQKCASGSWLGYHANVYYHGFERPKVGDHFSTEWGLMDVFNNDHDTGWEEMDPEFVKRHHLAKAGNKKIEPMLKSQREANDVLRRAKVELESVFTMRSDELDTFLTKITGEILVIEPLNASELARHWQPSTSMTRDSLALSQGVVVPPHLDIRSRVASVQSTFHCVKAIKEKLETMSIHLQRSRVAKQTKRLEAMSQGTKVFIGHGGSQIWRELKDYVKDDLGLEVDEFNTVSVWESPTRSG